MVASRLITLASLPVYSALYRTFSAVGLVIASDLGIAANCLGIAFLLHRRNLVPAGSLEWKEIGKALLISVGAGFVSWKIAQVVTLSGSRIADLEALGLTTASWGGAVALGLWLMKSKLPRDLRRRKQN
jgi:hypothetical protein